MEQFDQRQRNQKANVYFDGRCVSHSLILADGGTQIRWGDPAGATLTFNTGAPEIMEVLAGQCSVQLKATRRNRAWHQSFSVPGDRRLTSR